MDKQLFFCRSILEFFTKKLTQLWIEAEILRKWQAKTGQSIKVFSTWPTVPPKIIFQGA